MNIEHIKELRAFIAELPGDACNMDTWFAPAHDEHNRSIPLTIMAERGFRCGAAACIGGWTQAMIALKNGLPDVIDECNGSAQGYLGLSYEESERLFYEFPEPDEAPVSWKQWMLTRLDHIIETGEIDYWADVAELHREFEEELP